MSFNRYENLKTVAAVYYKVCKEANELFHKGGDAINKGFDLFIEKWLCINHVQAASARYSKNNNDAAKLCVEFAKICVYCLAHTVDIKTQIKWHKDALDAALKLDEPENIYITKHNLAIALIKAKKEEEAIKLLNENLIFAKSTKNKVREARVLNNLGITYKNLKQYSKALTSQEKRLEIAKELKDEAGQIHALGGIGNVYRKKGDYDNALKYHYSRLKLAKKINNPDKIGNALGDLGKTYMAIKDFDKSKEFFSKQLRLTNKYNFQDGKGRALWGLAQSLYSQGKLIEAIANGDETLKIKKAKEDPDVPEIQKTLLEWRNEIG